MLDSKFSPLPYARVGGLIYLAIIALGLYGEVFVRGTLVRSGDAATTAANILGSLNLWRSGIAGDLLMHVLDVPLIVILYLLLKPIGKGLAQLATLLNIVQTSVLVANKITLVAAVLILSSSLPLSALSRPERDALSYLAVNLHGYGFGIGLIFFGVASLVRGYLIFKSGYFPRTLGALLAIAGLSYLINSFALLLAPSLASAMFPAILMPAFVGEMAFCLWLIFKRVDVNAWNVQLAAHARGSSNEA